MSALVCRFAAVSCSRSLATSLTMNLNTDCILDLMPCTSMSSSAPSTTRSLISDAISARTKESHLVPFECSHNARETNSVNDFSNSEKCTRFVESTMPRTQMPMKVHKSIV